MSKYADFDFGRANTLMQTIVEAGKHGTLYQKLGSMAGEELREMLEEAGKIDPPKPAPAPTPRPKAIVRSQPDEEEPRR